MLGITQEYDVMTLGALVVAAAVLGVHEGMAADRAVATVVVDGLAQIAGEWRVTQMRDKSMAAALVSPSDFRIMFQGGHMKVTVGKQTAEEYHVRLNPMATPKRIDFIRSGGNVEVTGVYERREGKLYLYYRTDGVRPTKLSLPREGGMMVLQRVEKK